MAASWQARVARATEERKRAAESVILEGVSDLTDDIQSESTDTRTDTSNFEQALVATG
jgi:hypothetical protein